MCASPAATCRYKVRCAYVCTCTHPHPSRCSHAHTPQVHPSTSPLQVHTHTHIHPGAHMHIHTHQVHTHTPFTSPPLTHTHTHLGAYKTQQERRPHSARCAFSSCSRAISGLIQITSQKNAPSCFSLLRIRAPSCLGEDTTAIRWPVSCLGLSEAAGRRGEGGSPPALVSPC